MTPTPWNPRPLLTLPGSLSAQEAADEFGRTPFPGPRRVVAFEEQPRGEPLPGAVCPASGLGARFRLQGLGCWYVIVRVGKEWQVWWTEEREDGI